MRLMEDGPVPGEMRTTSSRPTERSFCEGTVILARPSTPPRNCSWARTTTSYWSSPALKVEAVWPATRVLSACSISITLTPRSAARGRSISRRTSGLPLRSVVSVSTRPGLSLILASSAWEYSVSFRRSGPWMRLNRSEEHTSELQSPCNLVCRLLVDNIDLGHAVHLHRHAFARIDLRRLHINGQQLEREDSHLFVHRPNEPAAAFDDFYPDITRGAIGIYYLSFAAGND